MSLKKSNKKYVKAVWSGVERSIVRTFCKTSQLSSLDRKTETAMNGESIVVRIKTAS